MSCRSSSGYLRMIAVALVVTLVTLLALGQINKPARAEKHLAVGKRVTFERGIDPAFPRLQASKGERETSIS